MTAIVIRPAAPAKPLIASILEYTLLTASCRAVPITGIALPASIFPVLTAIVSFHPVIVVCTVKTKQITDTDIFIMFFTVFT